MDKERCRAMSLLPCWRWGYCEMCDMQLSSHLFCSVSFYSSLLFYPALVKNDWSSHDTVGRLVMKLHIVVCVVRLYEDIGEKLMCWGYMSMALAEYCIWRVTWAWYTVWISCTVKEVTWLLCRCCTYMWGASIKHDQNSSISSCMFEGLVLDDSILMCK